MLRTCRKPCASSGVATIRNDHARSVVGVAIAIRTVERTLHDLGDLVRERPRDLLLTYSQHYCCKCKSYFNVDMSDLALPKSHYTHRVVAMAVRLVVEDGLPYRAASWHLWRDHRVFVPYATIQNWVECGGKKGGATHPRRLPGRRAG